MKRTTNTKSARIAGPAVEAVATPDDDTLTDDELQIRFSLTALGELAVARGERGGRGIRFRGFGPCGAVA